MKRAPDNLKLYDRAIADGTRAAKEARSAWRDFNRAKTRQGQTAALLRATEAEKRERLAGARADKYGNKLATSEIAREAKERRTAKAGEVIKKVETGKEQERRSPEWFVGLRYTERGHRAMLDFTVSRVDGEDLSEREAKAVVKQLHEGATPEQIAPAYRVDGVAWMRSGGQRRTGSASDLGDFSSLIQGVMLKDFRIEVSKPDE